MPEHGILNLIKPHGITSMDAIRMVKALTLEKKVGHGGTLDPAATGVLAVCFGQATRMMEFLINGVKVYDADVVLGVATDTFDATGHKVAVQDPSKISEEDVDNALNDFRGVISQIPPMFSALKKDGQRLYELAREGTEVPRLPRKVHVIRLELKKWDPHSLTLEVECGRGIYIRSLAHDLGQALGCGAFLNALSRQSSGPFHIKDAVTMEQLEERVRNGSWKELLHPLDSVVLNLRAIVVGSFNEMEIRRGRPIYLPVSVENPPIQRETCRVYTSDGLLLALAWYDRIDACWRPHKVFNLPKS